jgi:hypothetical protein
MSELQLLRHAYLEMAKRANYRPAAVEDGFGNILLVEGLTDEDTLNAEAHEYAARFVEEENDRTFRLGCCDARTVHIFCWTIEAARQLCCGPAGNATALKLLQMAAEALAELEEQRT